MAIASVHIECILSIEYCFPSVFGSGHQHVGCKLEEDTEVDKRQDVGFMWGGTAPDDIQDAF